MGKKGNRALSRRSKPAWQRYLESFVIPVVVFGLPAYFGSHYLVGLTANALWLPPEWKTWVTWIGTVWGMAAFNAMRFWMKSRRKEPHLIEPRHEFWKYRIAGLWLIPVIVLGAACLWLRDSSTVELTLDEDISVDMLSKAGVDAEGRYVIDSNSSAVRYEYIGPRSVKATVTLPFTFDDGGLRATLAARSQGDVQSLTRHEVVEQSMMHAVDDVPTEINRQLASLQITKYLFLLLHLAVLFSAGVSLGAAFSSAEEGGNAIRELVHS